jgi:hypothetical protein
MLTHKRFDDEQILLLADVIAYAEVCAEQELSPLQPVLDFRSAVAQLLTVSVYKKKLFESTYQNNKAEFNVYFSSRREDECKKIKTEFPAMTAQINQQYTSIANARQRDLQAIGNAMADMGNIPSTSYMPQMPSNTVTPMSVSPSTQKTRIYTSGQCSGAIVNGSCEGAVIDTGVPKYCYGTMLQGKCHGTVNY